MQHSPIAVLDIGSTETRVLLCDLGANDELRVLAFGAEPTLGVRKGAIINTDNVAASIQAAVRRASQMSGMTITSLVVSVGGTDIKVQEGSGLISVGQIDGEVTQSDVDRAIDSIYTRTIVSPNREVIRVEPVAYKLDDQDDLKDPVGLRGLRLEVRALITTVGVQHTKLIEKAIHTAGYEVQAFVPEYIATTRATLSPRMREAGVALCHIGAQYTTLAVYEDDCLLMLTHIPVGGSHVTNDVVLFLRSTLEVAEQAKMKYGHALPDMVNPRQGIDLIEFDPSEDFVASQQEMSEAIAARLEELFELVNKELRLVNKERKLPAGIVLSGGGALIPGTVELAKGVVGMSVMLARPPRLTGLVDKLDPLTAAPLIGLAFLASEDIDLASGSNSGPAASGVMGSVGQAFRRALQAVGKFIKNLLP